MRFLTGLLLVPVLSLAPQARLRADFIVAYDLQGQPGTQVSTSPFEEANHTSGLLLTRGAGLVPSSGSTSGTNTLGSSGWDTRAADDYVTFGFVVDPGFQATLENLQLRTGAHFTGPSQVGLFYSGDGFSTPITTFTHSVGFPNTTSVFSSQVDLSALPQMQGQVEFRLYSVSDVAAGGGAVGSQGVFFVGNFLDGRNILKFSVSGSITAVPEPGSMCLLAASIGAAMFIRPRRRNELRAGLQIRFYPHRLA